MSYDNKKSNVLLLLNKLSENIQKDIYDENILEEIQDILSYYTSQNYILNFDEQLVDYMIKGMIVSYVTNTNK